MILIITEGEYSDFHIDSIIHMDTIPNEAVMEQRYNNLREEIMNNNRMIYDKINLMFSQEQKGVIKYSKENYRDFDSQLRSLNKEWKEILIKEFGARQATDKEVQKIHLDSY